jgi:uncharacterized membrane protein
MTGEPESLDFDEDLDARRHRHWFDRLIMLSDGVFAIAVTLLSLDIRGPADWNSLGELWAGLAPQLDAYALSFLVIAIYWLAHRRLMAQIVTVDAPLTVLTLVMLALVALVPGATHLPRRMDSSMILYGALIILIGLSIAALWGYAALIAKLVAPQVSRGSRWFQLALMVVTPALFLFLVNLVPAPPWAATPLLAGLFLIGWPMRLWVLRRLERAPSTIGSSADGPPPAAARGR